MVQIVESGGNPGDHSRIAEKLFNGHEVFFDNFPDTEKTSLGTPLGNLKNGLLCPGQDRIHFFIVPITATDNFGGGLDEIPKDLFFPDDFSMIGDSRCCRNGAGCALGNPF